MHKLRQLRESNRTVAEACAWANSLRISPRNWDVIAVIVSVQLRILTWWNAWWKWVPGITVMERVMELARDGTRDYPCDLVEEPGWLSWITVPWSTVILTVILGYSWCWTNGRRQLHRECLYPKTEQAPTPSDVLTQYFLTLFYKNDEVHNYQLHQKLTLRSYRSLALVLV